jgi:hypothetical protein
MTITLTREEAQQVEQYIRPGAVVPVDMQTTKLLVNALRTRLSAPEPAPTNNGRYLTGYKTQPELKPVAWLEPEWGEDYRAMYLKVRDELAELQQREWQGLTDEEAAEVERWIEFKEEGSGRIPTGKLIRYIEAKLKEKNT